MAPSTPQRAMSAAELFREHGEFVARFLFRLGVPADAIDDAVQEVFLVVHQRGGYRPGPAKPTTYLGVIATNAAATHRRRARTRAARESSAPLDEMGCQAPNPEHSLESRDQLRRLQAALDKLDPDLRATLLLADAEGQTSVSIAKAMEVPVGTVYWRLSEARKRFKRALEVVDAAERAAERAASTETRKLQPGALARSMGVLIMVFGWRNSKAYALLREAGPRMPIPYDLEAGLRRHEASLAQQPPVDAGPSLPPPAPVGSTLASLGGVKVGLGVVGAGALMVAIAALPWAPSPGEATVPAQAAPHAQSHAVPVAAQVSAQPAAPTASAPTAAPVAPSLAPDPQANPRTLPLAAAEHAAPSHAASTRDARAARSPSSSRATTTRRAAPKAAARRTSAPAHDRTARRVTAAEPPADDAPLEDALAQAAPPATPAPAPAERERLTEVQALGRAHALLHSHPSQALALVRQITRDGSATYLDEERRYIEVMALFALGQQREGERSAKAFLASYPQSSFRTQVLRARDGELAAR